MVELTGSDLLSEFDNRERQSRLSSKHNPLRNTLFLKTVLRQIRQQKGIRVCMQGMQRACAPISRAVHGSSTKTGKAGAESDPHKKQT